MQRHERAIPLTSGHPAYNKRGCLISPQNKKVGRENVQFSVQPFCVAVFLEKWRGGCPPPLEGYGLKPQEATERAVALDVTQYALHLDFAPSYPMPHNRPRLVRCARTSLRGRIYADCQKCVASAILKFSLHFTNGQINPAKIESLWYLVSLFRKVLRMQQHSLLRIPILKQWCRMMSKAVATCAVLL